MIWFLGALALSIIIYYLIKDYDDDGCCEDEALDSDFVSSLQKDTPKKADKPKAKVKKSKAKKKPKAKKTPKKEKEKVVKKPTREQRTKAYKKIQKIYKKRGYILTQRQAADLFDDYLAAVGLIWLFSLPNENDFYSDLNKEVDVADYGTEVEYKTDGGESGGGGASGSWDEGSSDSSYDSDSSSSGDD